MVSWINKIECFNYLLKYIVCLIQLPTQVHCLFIQVHRLFKSTSFVQIHHLFNTSSVQSTSFDIGRQGMARRRVFLIRKLMLWEGRMKLVSVSMWVRMLLIRSGCPLEPSTVPPCVVGTLYESLGSQHNMYSVAIHDVMKLNSLSRHPSFKYRQLTADIILWHYDWTDIVLQNHVIGNIKFQ